MREWFVCLCKPQQEARAVVELENQGFETHLAVLDGRPMFPRYLFVAFDRLTDPWGKVKNTRGCVDLLKTGATPSRVPPDVMEAIIAYRPPEKPADGETEFKADDVVVIVDGVLRGLNALFVADKNQRVSCLVEIMGKRVEVPRASICAA